MPGGGPPSQDFKKSDELREQLGALASRLKDTAQGQTWSR